MPSRNRTLQPKKSAEGAWWNSPFGVFQTNIQEIDATMDVEAVLDHIQGHGANVWLLNTGGIVSFYPTDLPFQTRAPYLVDRPSGDMIGDAIAAAHKRGVKIISRCDFSKVSGKIAAEHPEWLFLSPKGERQIYNTLYSTCPCGEYFQERSLDIIDEIVERYPVDGFFFNWFMFSERDYSRVYHGVCQCEKCQAAFGAFSGGKPLPTDPTSPTYPEWMRFANGVLVDLTERISSHIFERRPSSALVLGRGAPIIMHEANNAFGRELWPHLTSENVSSFTTGYPDVPLLVNSVSFVDMPYRMAGEQPEHFAQYLIQCIARRGNPSTYIMGVPGRIPYANLPLAGEITRFYMKNADLYGKLTTSATIALARPDRLRSAEPGYEQSVSEFRGIYRTLSELHLPFDVIESDLIDKMAADGNLEHYRLVILPDLGSLGAEVAKCLDEYVDKGGNLILTGSSCVDAGGGAELDHSPFVMRVGAPLTGQGLWSTYVSASDQDQAGEYSYAPPIVPVYGSYARFVWKPNAQRVGKLLPQAPFGPPEKCYGHAGSDDPSAARLVRGGTVLHFPWTVGHTYYEFGTTEVRDHLAQQITALERPPVSADLPEQVEIMTGTSGSQAVIHIINQTGWRRKSFGPHVPVEGGVVRVKGGKSARLLVSGDAPKTRQVEDVLVIDLPSLGLFEVLCVEV